MEEWQPNRVQMFGRPLRTGGSVYLLLFMGAWLVIGLVVLDSAFVAGFAAAGMLTGVVLLIYGAVADARSH